MVGALSSRAAIVLAVIVIATGYLSSSPSSAQAVPQPLNGLTILANSNHSLGVQGVAFSSDGRVLVTCSNDGTIKLWEVPTGRLLRTLVGQGDDFYEVAISPDAHWIASGTWNGTIKLWDGATGAFLRTIRDPADFVGTPVSAKRKLAFSRDGKSLYIIDSNAIRRWDLAGAAFRQTLASLGATKGPVFRGLIDFALSSDDRLLAVIESVAFKNYYFVRILDTATGNTIRSFEINTDNPNKVEIYSFEFAPDARSVLVGFRDGTAKTWDLTGKHLQTFSHSDSVWAATFSPDSRLIATTSGLEHKLWDAATGQLIKKFDGLDGSVAAFSPDGHWIAFATTLVAVDGSAAERKTFGFEDRNRSASATVLFPDNDRWLTLGPAGLIEWDAVSGQVMRSLARYADASWPALCCFARDALNRTLVVVASGKSLDIWDLAAGKAIQSFDWGPGEELSGFGVSAVAISSDARLLAASPFFKDIKTPRDIKIWTLANGRVFHTLHRSAESFNGLTLSPDGRLLISGQRNEKDNLLIWDVETGKPLRTVRLPDFSQSTPLTTSPNGKWVTTVEGVPENPFHKPIPDQYLTVGLRDLLTGELIRTFKKDGVNNNGYITAFSSDSRWLFVGLLNSVSINMWDTATGDFVRTLEGNPGLAWSLAVSPDGTRLISGNLNGTSAVWNLANGTLLATTVQSRSGEWVTITPEGFFAASDKGAELLHVVQGFETTGIDQVYQSLYRPDLVRQKLAGDPNGQVRTAAAKLDLNKVIASGAAPAVAITSPANGASERDQVTLEAQVTDKGGGIGRIEWRVNGTTLGIDEADAAGSSGAKKVSRTLALDDGDNTIEVVAYNAKNLIASVPARIKVTSEATAAAPPRLFVLAVGIDDYYDSRLRLNFPVADAKALAAGFEAAGKGLYETVNVTTLLDTDATKSKIGAKFAEISAAIRPRDVFVFFMAGHGKTQDGRYYFIPQNFRYDSDSAVAQQGISQDELQAWLAQIRAKKSLLLFDTCESGSLTGDKAGTRGLEGVAAIERLTRAMGRSVLSASTDSAPALEGYMGHGVFTYALLDAMGRADTDKDGLIEVTQLASFIDAEVPEISQKAFNYRQIPQMKLVGSNFPLVREVAVLDAGASVIPRKPTHVTIRPAEVFPEPSDTAPTLKLEPGTTVTVMKSEQGWVLIAKDGNQLGYVAASTLVPVH